MGIFGLFSGCLVFFSSIYYILKIKLKKSFTIFILSFSSFIFIEAINLDITKFKHLWFVLAFLSHIITNSNSKTNKN